MDVVAVVQDRSFSLVAASSIDLTPLPRPRLIEPRAMPALTRALLLMATPLVALASGGVVDGGDGAKGIGSELQCPQGWVNAIDQGLDCLKFHHTDRHQWEASWAYCQENNATFLTWSSKTEWWHLEVYLEALNSKFGVGEWWVGGKRVGGEWKWWSPEDPIEGTPLPDLFPWGWGEPSDAGDCMELREDYTTKKFRAHAASCTLFNAHICRTEPLTL